MYSEKLILTFYAHTPVHVGSGTSVSYVDLPVQREKHTDLPIIAGSGIKGVIRDLALRKWNDKNKVNIIFGPEPEESSSEHASCISFTDAKILLFPVRSLKGVFAYITCPFVLKRFKRDLESAGNCLENENSFDNINVEEKKVLLPEIKNEHSEILSNNSVILEEFAFEFENTNETTKIANALRKFLPNELPVNFEKHFAIVSDNTFTYFVKHAIEIRTRIRIDQEKGTVKKGHLFSMELVPSESVFYSLVFISEPKKKEEGITRESVKSDIKELLNNQLIQFGGDETLGFGLMKIKINDCPKNGG